MITKLQKFNDEVVLKYHLYNGLFLTLPFSGTQESGAWLASFASFCAHESLDTQSPSQLVDAFFRNNLKIHDEEEKIGCLFKMLQFLERQVLLIDSLEDAAFLNTHDLNGSGSLHHLLTKVENAGKEKSFCKTLDSYQVKIVLTAHPTQFYPKQVLTILPQLIEEFQKNDLNRINELLIQMGKTSFSHKQKPTPFQEAKSLLWYLENCLYSIVSRVQTSIDAAAVDFGYPKKHSQNAVAVGFWPGGDRDGNPFVTADTTLEVAKLLKTSILELYLNDLQRLIHKLTFVDVLDKLEAIKGKLFETQKAAITDSPQMASEAIYLHSSELLKDLEEIKTLLILNDNSLFLDSLQELITKIQCFGFHFAAMDMREDSGVHRKVLEEYRSTNTGSLFTTTTNSIRAIKKVQSNNGEEGLCRYIVSHTETAQDILDVLSLLTLFGEFHGAIPVDIIPLFETIEDLENAPKIMKKLYKDINYLKHLKHRKNQQTIMMGFSDGTKDGGYVAANWSIYKAKVKLTALSKKCGVEVAFFDGRGGPPGRGGGNTHDFYRSLGSKISHSHPQLTIQGQTIGVTFGVKEAASFNLEQFFTAGIYDLIFSDEANDLSYADCKLLDRLSEESVKGYEQLKSDPLFVPYLEQITPLRFYGDLNIGSRPASRKKDSGFSLSDLRAIPFVGSWSQIKQNIPGYYGFGYALKVLMSEGCEKQLKRLYKKSLFFRTLTNNSMMSLLKTRFELTQYLKDDKKFGKFWLNLRDEAELTKQMVLVVSDQKELLEHDPVVRASIKIREEIVQPLLIIQMAALENMQKMDSEHSRWYLAYKKIVLKALAANTNASRNSA